jgi:hypothetical protein
MYDASQFGQLNRLTWDLSYTDLHNGLKKVMLTNSPIIRARTNRQAARERPVTLSLLPVETCEML